MVSRSQADLHAPAPRPSASLSELVLPSRSAQFVRQEMPTKKCETVFDVAREMKIDGAQGSTVCNGLASGVGPWTGKPGGNVWTSAPQKPDGAVFTIEKLSNGNVRVTHRVGNNSQSTDVDIKGDLLPRQSGLSG